jgi:hypothetical protein
VLLCASAAKHLTATSDWFYTPWHQGHPLTPTSDRFLPPQAIQKWSSQSYRHKQSGLEMLHLPRKNITHSRQKKRSLAAVKK